MALKMTKLDNCDWVDRQPGEQWWDQFVANLTSDMMEDLCFQIIFTTQLSFPKFKIAKTCALLFLCLLTFNEKRIKEFSIPNRNVIVFSSWSVR